ncbi:EamA family transporter [Dickeya oryzae]
MLSEEQLQIVHTVYDRVINGVLATRELAYPDLYQIVKGLGPVGRSRYDAMTVGGVNMHTRNNHIWVMVVMAVFFWGSNFNAIAELDANLPPIISSIIRFVIASVIFSFTFFVFRGRDISLSAKDFLSLALLGFFGDFFVFNYAIFRRNEVNIAD